MHERVYKRDLKVNLLSTQRGSDGQGPDLVECPRKLLYGFNKCRARQRPLSGFAPQARSLFGLPGFGAVTGQQFGLVLGSLCELAF
jgi:hypothetical protein